MMNVKGNKPSVMVMKFEDFNCAEAAKRKGEAYVREPDFTFLIHDCDDNDHTPLTLQTIRQIIRERKARRTASASTAAGEVEDEEATDELPQLQTAKLLSGHSSDATDEEVHGIKLRGNVRNWWNELTEMLQPEDWPVKIWSITLSIFKIGSVCGGVKMDALRVRRHFEEGEVEEVEKEINS